MGDDIRLSDSHSRDRHAPLSGTDNWDYKYLKQLDYMLRNVRCRLLYD